MGSKGSTKVKAPDPMKIAQADAMFNRIDQFTPFSSLQFYGPNRNQAVQRLNPAMQFAANQDMLSDIMVNQMGLGRAADMKGGSLPSLTTGINPTAQQDFFGLPENLTGGFDAPNTGVPVPDFIGDFQGGTPNPTVGPPGSRLTGDRQRGIAGRMANRTSGVQVPAGQDPYNNASGGFGIPGGTSTPVLPPVGQGQVPPAAQGGKGAKGGQPQQMQGQPQQMQGQPQPPAAAEAPTDGIFGGSIGSLFNKGFGLDQEGINRGRTEQAIFDRSASLLRPEFDRSEERLLQDLANRGIPRDSEAGRRELTDFRNQRESAFTRLGQDAIAGGGAEVQRQQQALGQLFGMGQNLAQQDIFTQLQNANIQQANRATQFNELAALLGLNQVAQPGLQNFFTPGQADVTGGFALNQQAQQANANNAANMKGGLIDGGVGLATAGILRN